MPTVDLATLAFEIDASRADAGARKVNSALDSIEKKADAVTQRINEFNGRLGASVQTSALEKSARGVESANRQAAASLKDVERGVASVSRAQQKAADDALRHAQAFARLLQAQGKSADAIKALERALGQYQGSQIQVLRVQTQLTNLQNDYANSPLISAVRAQSEAMGSLGRASGQASANFAQTAKAGTALGDSLSSSTAATIAQAQALAQLQVLQGDNAAAARTLADALQTVSAQQEQALASKSSFGSRLLEGLRAATAVVNAVTAGLQFYTTLRGEAGQTTTEAEAAAKAVSRSFEFARAGAKAVKNAADEATASLSRMAAIAKGAFGAPAEGRAVAAPAAGPVTAQNLLERIRAANKAVLESSRKEEGEKDAQQAAKLAQQAKSTARFFEQLDKAKRAALRFGREETGSASLIDFLEGLSSVADRAAARVSTAASSISQRIRASFAGDLGDRVRAVFDSFGGGAEGAAGKLESLNNRAQFATGVFTLVAGKVAFMAAAFTALAVAIAAATPILIGIGAVGVRANAQFEQVKLGIASITASVAELRTGEGVKLEGINELNAALPIAQKQLDALRVDALQTALTFEQIAPAFLQAVGPGLAAGLNLDQIRKTVIDLSQLIIPLTGNAAQLGQELRAIFSGDINQDTQVAKALGITKEQIEAAKEQGKLADFLNEKLKVAAATGALMARTFEAATSNLREAGTVLAGRVTEGFFSALRDKLNATLPTIFETAGGTVEISARFKGIADTFTEVFDRLGQRAVQAIDFALRQIESLSRFLESARIPVLRLLDATDLLIDRITILGKTLVSELGFDGKGAIIDIAQELEDLSLIIAFLQDVGELFGVSFLGTIKEIAFVIEDRLNEALKFLGIQIQALDKDVQRLEGDLIQLEDRFQQGFKNVRETQNRIEIARGLNAIDAKQRAQVVLFLGQEFDLPGGGTDVITGGRGTKIVPPKPTREAGGGKSRAESEARAIREAQLALEKSAVEQTVRLLKAEREERLALLKEQYDQGLIATRRFYDEKVKIAADNIDAEISLLRIEQQLLEDARGSAKGAEKIRIEQRIGEVIAEQELKVIELTKAFRENFAEFKKITALPAFDPSQTIEEVAPIESPLILGARARLKDLKAASEEFDRLQANLERDRTIIDQRVAAGALDEVEGRKALAAVERKYRDQLVSTLEARREIAIIEKGASSAAVAQIEAEIEALKSLGQEITNTQRFLRGLGPGSDTGRLFEDLGSGLRDAIRAGFTDGFAGARRSFGDLLKNLAADFLTSQLIQLLRNIFNPQAAGQTGGAAGGAVQTGGGGLSAAIGRVTSALEGGGGGGGNFTTPPIAGGSIPGASGARIPGLGGGFNLGGILSKIPGLSGIFDSFEKTAAQGRLNSLPLLDAAGNAIPGSAAAAAPGLLGSLGGFGLLAGGGFLGSLLGGSSPTRRLLGGLGGTLGAGALGATGIFGGGIAAALPALFSNPITAIVAGGILGGLALFKVFGGGEFKKFAKATQDAYQVKVKDDPPGRELYKAVKQIGEGAFGSFGKNISRTIQLDEARDLIGQYAEATNQENSALVKRLRQIREIGEIGNPANQFVRRAFGGGFLAGQTVIAGERGAEVIQAGSSGHVFPSITDYLDRAFAQLERRRAISPGAGGQQMAAILGALIGQLERLGAVPPGYVFMQGAEESRGQVGRLVREGFAASPGEQREFSQQLGL